MRWTATISCYEQRDRALTGIDALCRKSDYSWVEHYTPFARRRPTHRATARHELKLGLRRGDRTRTCDPWSPRPALISSRGSEFRNSGFIRERLDRGLACS